MIHGKAAIFDLDGTILNTLPDLGGSLNLALESFGFPIHDMSQYKYMVGNGMGQLVLRSLPEDKRVPEIANEVRERFKAEYLIHQCDLTVPYDGIRELLKKLSDSGWSLGVLSNKDHENTQTIINHFFPNQFQCQLGVTAQRLPKPNPDGALEAANILGVNPEKIYYFGDSDVDMTTCLTVGFIPLGVAWGFRPVEELKAAGARTILNHPLDFFTFLESDHD